MPATELTGRTNLVSTRSMSAAAPISCRETGSKPPATAATSRRASGIRAPSPPGIRAVLVVIAGGASLVGLLEQEGAPAVREALQARHLGMERLGRVELARVRRDVRRDQRLMALHQRSQLAPVQPVLGDVLHVA